MDHGCISCQGLFQIIHGPWSGWNANLYVHHSYSLEFQDSLWSHFRQCANLWNKKEKLLGNYGYSVILGIVCDLRLRIWRAVARCHSALCCINGWSICECCIRCYYGHIVEKGSLIWLIGLCQSHVYRYRCWWCHRMHLRRTYDIVYSSQMGVLHL